jgi:hypothetical protein
MEMVLKDIRHTQTVVNTVNMVQLAHQSLVLCLGIKGGAQSRIVERTGELFNLCVRQLLVDL